jgi:hypothetical protein
VPSILSAILWSVTHKKRRKGKAIFSYIIQKGRRLTILGKLKGLESMLLSLRTGNLTSNLISNLG